MSVTVVLGSQFGDEGKGKLVDVLLSSGKFGLVARCAGGHNAGHSLVVNGQNFDFHILPSGLIAPNAVNLIGNGTVFHVPQFFKELKNLQEKGVSSDGRIFVSDRAHVLFQLHKCVDGLREKALGASKVGTTGNGIGTLVSYTNFCLCHVPAPLDPINLGGWCRDLNQLRKNEATDQAYQQRIRPCYSDKASRNGIRVIDILDKPFFDRRLRALEKIYRDEFGSMLDYDVEKEIEEFNEYRKTLKPFIVDSLEIVCKAQDGGQEVLVEAANALCLDIDAGTYPYVTSSSTGIAGVFSGLLGIRPETVNTRIGVVKAYSTRVGSGPLPTEDLGELGEQYQTVGREFGTTTGRRRRCGNLDLVLLRHTTAINRYTSLNLTKLDVLDGFKSLEVAVAYHTTDLEGNKRTWRDRLPADLTQLDSKNCQVENVKLQGWNSDITKCKTWEDLPQEAREYVEFIEKEVGVPINWIGVGPGRDAMIARF